jgi:hypothetical protein
MSRYRRDTYKGPTNVTLAWSQTIGAYELKFDNAFNQWDKVKSVIEWIKMTIPAGYERDYDENTKVWTIHEKYFQTLKNVIELISEFNTTIFEKPENNQQFGQVKYVPLKEYTDLFKYVTNEDVTQLEFKQAQKVYRIAAMRMHPDKNPTDLNAGQKMSEFNEAWDVIKEKHFKIIRTMEQVV